MILKTAKAALLKKKNNNTQLRTETWSLHSPSGRPVFFVFFFFLQKSTSFRHKLRKPENAVSRNVSGKIKV